MKQLIWLSLIILIPVFSLAQSSDTTGRFGFVLNSSLNGEVNPVRIVPSVSYTMGNNQLELGVGVNPFDRKDQKVLSTEFNYKYFPNGMGNKFNMYLIARLSYLNMRRDTYYPTTYNYLFLNPGYGIELRAYKSLYMGTNISVGTFTYSKKSEVPYESFASKNLFDEIGFNMAFQFNLGYRF